MKRKTTLIAFLLGFFILCSVHQGNSDPLEKIHYGNSLDKIPFVRSVEDCQSIAATAQNLKLGFPFNDVSRVKYNGFTYIIGKQIQELNNASLLDESNIKNTLQDIINVNSNRTKKEDWLNSYVNYGALQIEEPELELDLLLAAFSIASSKGIITDIEPFLKFSKVYFGSDWEAMEVGFVIDSLVELEINKDLTPEQRQKFWPAADAILSNPNVSIPLLVKAVQNDSMSELLRLRGVGFLLVMDKSKVDEIIIPTVEPQIAKKIQCMIDAKGDWRGACTNICENLAKYQEYLSQ